VPATQTNATPPNHAPLQQRELDRAYGLHGAPLLGVEELVCLVHQLSRPTLAHHLAGSGACTWFEYAEALVAAAGQAATVRPTTTAAFGARAPRPANSRLEGRHAAMVGLEPLPHWREALPRQVERAAGLRHPPRAGEH